MRVCGHAADAPLSLPLLLTPTRPPPMRPALPQTPATKPKADPVDKALKEYSVVQQNPWNKEEM